MKKQGKYSRLIYFYTNLYCYKNIKWNFFEKMNKLERI